MSDHSEFYLLFYLKFAYAESKNAVQLLWAATLLQQNVVKTTQSLNLAEEVCADLRHVSRRHNPAGLPSALMALLAGSSLTNVKAACATAG